VSSSSDAVPAIAFDHVDFSYDGEPILADVSLSVPRGEFATVVGPNGGGKTSLLLLALGMRRPDRGTIRILGGAPDRSRGSMGYVPQFGRFDPLFPVTVADVVQMGRLGRVPVGPYSREDKEAAMASLEHVGLGDLHRRPFSDLSGGQRQRILIARALATDPKILLLDEPTANVDRLATDKLYELLAELNRTLTVVLVSHDLGIVSRYARSVICVNRTVFTHPTSELTGEMIRELYGGQGVLVRHDQSHGAAAGNGG
jgi:zinc transport system ATP-binding protein